jgi:hypothetical protein
MRSLLLFSTKKGRGFFPKSSILEEGQEEKDEVFWYLRSKKP